MIDLNSPFASRSVREHVLRGCAALLLVVLGVWLLSPPTLMGGIAAVVCFGGAVFLARGCPTCWLVGLFQTIANTKGRPS